MEAQITAFLFSGAGIATVAAIAVWLGHKAHGRGYGLPGSPCLVTPPETPEEILMKKLLTKIEESRK